MRSLAIAALLLLVMMPCSSRGDVDDVIWSSSESSLLPPRPTAAKPEATHTTEGPTAADADSETPFDASLVDEGGGEALNSTQSSLDHDEESTEIVTVPDEDSSTISDEPPKIKDQPPSVLDPQPQSLDTAAVPAVSALNETQLDSLSASEIKTQLEEAERELSKANATVANATQALEQKKQDAKEPRKDYAEKEKLWNELEKIAQDKERADREFADAQQDATKFTSLLTIAESKVAQKQGKITQAIAEKADIPKWPAKKLKLETERDGLEAEEKALPDNIQNWEVNDVPSQLRAWQDMERKANLTRKTFGENQCETADKTVDPCLTIDGQLKDEETKENKAKKVYETTLSSIATAKKRLEEIPTKLLQVKLEIASVESDINNKTPEKADLKIAELNGELHLLKQAVVEATTNKENAERLLEEKRIAKVAAEQSDGGISKDEARKQAHSAGLAANSAKRTKIAIEKEIEVCENKLKAARVSYEKAEKNVNTLTAKYEEAMRREDKPKTGNLSAIFGGIGGGAVLLAVIAAVVVVVRRQMKKKPKPGADAKKREKQPLLDANGQPTPTTGPSVPQASTNPGPSQHPNIQVRPAGSSCPREATPANPDLTRVPGAGSERPNGKDYLPDPKTTPYNGEEPFKIPAKWFKWRGPLTRRNRWHTDGVHAMEGKTGTEKLENIWFDPNAMYATEIGQSEIMEDHGPQRAEIRAAPSG